MPAFLVLLFTSVGGWILKNIGPQILLSLGVGLVSYAGFHALAANLTSYVNAMGSSFSSFDAMFHLLGVYAGLQIFLSAIAIKVSIVASRVFFSKSSS